MGEISQVGILHRNIALQRSLEAQREIQLFKTVTLTKSLARQAQRQRQATKTLERQLQKTILIRKPKVPKRPPTIIKVPKPPPTELVKLEPPPEPKIPRLPRIWLAPKLDDEGMKKFAQGFIPYVRRKGKFVPLIKVPVTKKAAEAIGAKAAIESIARTFLIKPVIGKPRKVTPPRLPIGWREQFRPAKTPRLKGALVERSLFALSQQLEKQQIREARMLSEGFLRSPLSKKKKKRRKK